MSCDRDCTLDAWTEWSPCSQACDSGFHERVRNVLIPIRGNGECPKDSSTERLEEEPCNTHACNGDEICIAKQDLVLDIDASGSLKEDGFAIVRDFAANLTDKYQGEYYGHADMMIGLVLFGNGRLMDQADGTTYIADAKLILGLTSTMSEVKTTIQGLEWQQGFTNMAQGLHMADIVLSQGGREDAMSAVMVISDGKFSMKYQTAEKARELKDKSVQLYMVAISESRGTDIEEYREFSSEPHHTNYVRIPGLTALEYNAEMFSTEIITKFCPKAISPSQWKEEAEKHERILIHTFGYPSDECGAWHWHGKGHTMEDCQQLARELDLLAFAFGRGKYMEGGCYSEAIQVDDQFWETVLNDPRAPPCPNGYWLHNPYFDTYALKPLVTIDLTR
jgi:hypothetical protein